MTTVRHSLQREVFDPRGERLGAVCEVREDGGAPMRLCVVRGPGEPHAALVAGERGDWRRERVWPLRELRVLEPDRHSVELEVVAERTYAWTCANVEGRLEWARAAAGGADLEERELAALLEEAAPPADDAELWARSLADRLDALDDLNVQGMLGAEAGSAALLARLGAAGARCEALGGRLGRYEEAARGGAAPDRAREGAAVADRNARRLLLELEEALEWLEAPELADVDALSEVSLGTAEGRARALAGAEALRRALETEGRPPHLLRLGAVRGRLRALTRARERLGAALARHLNNTLIHLGNEAEAGGAGPPRRHHARLAPYAPFAGWLRACEPVTYRALLSVYTGSWSRVYERELRTHTEGARAAPLAALDRALDQVMDYVESTCDAEQEFCTRFYRLDDDPKLRPEDNSDVGGARRPGPEVRRVMGELFPGLEGELLALLAHVDRHDPYGAMRLLACVGARVVGEGEGGARWSRGALAAAAVAAKRAADGAVQARLRALPEAVRGASRRPKCGPLPFIAEFESFSARCETIFSRCGRRADVERWYVTLCGGMMRAIAEAEHPRTPRAVVQMENYHRLHAVVSTLRVPALESIRRETRSRYNDSLHTYVTQWFGRPLEKLNQFFEGVSEAMSRGVREEEVCYQAAFSKHELRKVLALYPPSEVSGALHRLYRTVEKHLSEEESLLQVVWRAMQEEFLAQHLALEARVQACYPGAGLALPLTTTHILEAFSAIARRH